VAWLIVGVVLLEVLIVIFASLQKAGGFQVANKLASAINQKNVTTGVIL
jgi:hypothetical protein